MRLPRTLRSARIYVNGKRALVVRSKAAGRSVTLRAVKASRRVRGKIVGKTRAGKRYHKTRVYDTCTKRAKRVSR